MKYCAKCGSGEHWADQCPRKDIGVVDGPLVDSTYGQILNHRPFEHRCRYGTVFKASRCDLAEGVEMIVPRDLSQEKRASDISEMIGYHCSMILNEHLNGFAGYDTIRYRITEVDE